MVFILLLMIAAQVSFQLALAMNTQAEEENNPAFVSRSKFGIVRAVCFKHKSLRRRRLADSNAQLANGSQDKDWRPSHQPSEYSIGEKIFSSLFVCVCATVCVPVSLFLFLNTSIAARLQSDQLC